MTRAFYPDTERPVAIILDEWREFPTKRLPDRECFDTWVGHKVVVVTTTYHIVGELLMPVVCTDGRYLGNTRCYRIAGSVRLGPCVRYEVNPDAVRSSCKDAVPLRAGQIANMSATTEATIPGSAIESIRLFVPPKPNKGVAEYECNKREREPDDRAGCIIHQYVRPTERPRQRDVVA